MSNTNITTTTDTTTVTVTENVVEIELNNVGVQGTPGLSGVVSVVSPITNVGSAGSAIVGINQALLSITKSQVSDFTSGTVTSASTAQQAGTALFATNASTAVFATTSGTATFANAAEQTLYLVRNNTGTTILKGTLLAASGAEPSGRIDVEPFVVTGLQDSELRVMGVATANISNGVNGTVMSFGTLVGVDTRGNFPSALAVGDETWAEGDILFAHPTVAGKLTKVRPQHDLDVAFITVRNATAGQIAIRIVPGNFHLEWLHDVSITSPTNNQVLTYDSASSLWVNANNPADGVTSITATAPLTGGTITSTGSIGLDQTALSITRSQVSDFTSGTVTSASTAQQAGTAVYSVNSGTAVYSTTSGTAVFANTSGTATFATTSGTAVYATNSGTAVFATNASTAVSVSGSAITQSQVVNLTTDLANRAVLNSANAFTVGGHTITTQSTGVSPLSLLSITGQTADVFRVTGLAGTFQITASGGVRSAFNTGNSFGGGTSANNILAVRANVATNVPLIVSAAASQSANLQEWQNSGGTAIALLSSGGRLGATTVTTLGNRIIASEAQSGGTIRFTKSTAAQTNPGADLASLYFRDGTNAGTLKLVVRAGAAGAETTILDNIPQT
jgi:hypothetical protein